jgi:ferredoxin
MDFVVTVDRELCMGSGLCVMYAPDSFAHDDLAKAVVLDSSAARLDEIRAAVDACPMGAISLTINEGA